MGSLAVTLVLITVLLGISGVVTGTPNTAVTSVLCNSDKYAKSDPFAISLAYVVDELEAVTPTRRDHNYYNISPYPNAFAYGHAGCSQNITSADCTTCLGAAKTAMFKACVSTIGARAVLHDCKIRYEQYPFNV